MTSSRLVGLLCVAALLAACGGSGDPGPATMTADGQSCSGDMECASGHCNSGLCCASGICCKDANACKDFGSDPECTVGGGQTDCQGTRRIATCEDHVCGSTIVTDDSACSSQTRTCDPYRPIACSGAVTQPVAVCATSCSSASDCAQGNTCVGRACIPISGAGQACTGTGQGSCGSAALKCENGVCCDAAAARCCKTSAACDAGLACNLSISACFTSCSNDSTDQCAAPGSAYCAGNACVTKLLTGATCSSPAQCASGACECFDARCSTRKCRPTWCGPCEYATSDSTCAAGLGSPAALADPNPNDGCSGPSSLCYAGSCKKIDGQDCAGNDECGSGSCRAGKCAQRSSVTGPCDTGDDADCQAGLACAAGICKRGNQQQCGSNTECASGSCRGSLCASPSAVNGPCDQGDAADCQSGLSCSGTVCKKPLGAACAAGECIDVCQNGTCKIAQGHTCSSDGQCATGACAGVCCDRPCEAPCNICTYPGSVGTCIDTPNACQ